MFWLEPLLEIDTKIGRVGFGPITENDVDDIIKLDESDLKNHKNYLGVIDDIPFLANQNRLTFKKLGSSIHYQLNNIVHMMDSLV